MKSETPQSASNLCLDYTDFLSYQVFTVKICALHPIIITFCSLNPPYAGLIKFCKNNHTLRVCASLVSKLLKDFIVGRISLELRLVQSCLHCGKKFAGVLDPAVTSRKV